MKTHKWAGGGRATIRLRHEPVRPRRPAGPFEASVVNNCAGWLSVVFSFESSCATSVASGTNANPTLPNQRVLHLRSHIHQYVGANLRCATEIGSAKDEFKVATETLPATVTRFTYTSSEAF